MKGALFFISGIISMTILTWMYIVLYPTSASQIVSSAAPQSETQTSSEEEEVKNPSGSNTTSGTTQLQKVWVKDHYEYILNFNNGAFSPPIITIKKGETIQFVNKDNLAMRVSVAFQGTPASTIIDPKAVSKGGTYSFMFTKSGTYVISNVDGALNPGGGVVNVVE